MTKNNSYTVNGFLVSAEPQPTQRGSVSVRKFQVKSKEEYPQLFEFELVDKNTGKNTGIIDGVPVGQEVNVNFSIRGREWNGKVFVNLSAFRVEALKASVAVPAPAKAKTAPVDDSKAVEPDEPVF